MNEEQELERVRRTYAVIEHCVEIGLSDDEVVLAAKMMLRSNDA